MGRKTLSKLDGLNIDTVNMKPLSEYIPSGTRNRLLFTSCRFEELTYTDVGADLANGIQSYLDDKHLPIIADQTIEDIIRNNVSSIHGIGECVAIENIGILFEPALQLNLNAKFNKWSSSYFLIVDCSDGVIQNNVFYLKNARNKSYNIDLSAIPYNIIEDEIQ